MMQHKGLEDGRWAEMSFISQMANIGSEVGRTAKWKKKGKPEMAQNAFYRALELIDLTIKFGRINEPEKRSAMLRELCRVRECFCEDYFSDDVNSVDALEQYFMHFAIAERLSSNKAKA